MTTRLKFLCLLLPMSFFLQAQSDDPAGLRLDDPSYSQVPLLPSYTGAKYNDVPLSASLRRYAPTPILASNDGYSGSIALAYYALTMCKAIKANLTDPAAITDMAHSAEFVYNQVVTIPRTGGCQGGATLPATLKLMKEQGVCLQSTFSPGDCKVKPGAQAIEEASRYKIKEYATVFTPDESPDRKVAKTYQSIADNHPVVVVLTVTTSFLEIKNGQEVWEPSPDDPSLYAHPFVVTGYHLLDKKFEIMGSLGQYWGDRGSIQISFEDFGRLARQGFQILVDQKFPVERGPAPRYTEVAAPVVETTPRGAPPVVKEKPLERPAEKRIENLIEAEEVVYTPETAVENYRWLEGEFGFRYLKEFQRTPDGRETYVFEEVPAVYNNSRQLYELTGKSWKVNDVFQLVARNISPGSSIYVFSKDATGKLSQHWPKNNGYDRRLNVPLANYIPSKNAEAVIPGEESGLVISHPGEDFLCILYSETEITDFSQRLEKVAQGQGTFNDLIKQAFGDLLIPREKINYNPNKMVLSSSFSQGEGAVAPLVLVAKSN